MISHHIAAASLLHAVAIGLGVLATLAILMNLIRNNPLLKLFVARQFMNLKV